MLDTGNYMIDPSAWWRWLRMWRRAHLAVDRVAVLEHVGEEGALRPRYGFMLVVSAGIAVLGLLQNSAAVVIGAMLISPLMGPIVEMGISLAVFDFRRLREALVTIAVGVAAALLTAMLVVSVSPLREATPEILARTQPTLFDLLVAVFSGLAGAYATVTRKGETIVGVAIATALMPPLAVIGFGIAIGNMHIAGGAAFLFMTNLLAIALSVTVVARWYGFGTSDTPHQTVLQAALIIGTFVVLSIPLGLALRDIAARAAADGTVRAMLERAVTAADGRVMSVRVNRDGRLLVVDATVLTRHHAPRLASTLEPRMERALGQPVRLQLSEVLAADDSALRAEELSLAQLRRSVEQLQGTAERAEREENARQQALAATRDLIVRRLGDFDVLEDGSVHWSLLPRSGIGIEEAFRLETTLAADAPARVRVTPASQPLPPLIFEDDSSEAGPAVRARAAAIRWALARWHAPGARVVGHGGAGRLAQARAETVAGLLGLPVAVEVADAEATRRAIALHGRSAVRSVTVEVLQTAPVVADPAPGPRP